MTDSKEPLPVEEDVTADGANPVDGCDEMASKQGRFLTCEEMEQLTAAVEEKGVRLEEMTARCQRLQADFDNFRRRTRQEKEELSSVVAQDLILQILPVIDNLERALGSSQLQDAQAIVSGVELIYRQLQGALVKNGMEVIEAVGTTFNPEEHQAVIRVEDTEQPDGAIVAELQKGYRVRGRVMRPSMVKVVSNN
jgi:molecular chaperone GrpE